MVTVFSLGALTSVIFLIAYQRSRNLSASIAYALFPAGIFVLSIYVAIPFLHTKVLELQNKRELMQTNQ
ncbi:hypothetical protein [Brucella anthropi]|uniref:hypothetical protein n=1 Tax=Brucella anthropi TaxID=529 RepID=UPI000CFB8559|nr:hypothetical protein [Ochrobactrum sp. MYb49]PQZ61805.1 hypothetical protein CQ057_22785 [Ochrobactrum sp. MYb49]